MLNLYTGITCAKYSISGQMLTKPKFSILDCSVITSIFQACVFYLSATFVLARFEIKGQVVLARENDISHFKMNHLNTLSPHSVYLYGIKKPVLKYRPAYIRNDVSYWQAFLLTSLQKEMS